MTWKLIGLMSLVLLLSLAVFALLTNHYQNQVMAEVARTASEVGKETLRTLNFQSIHESAPVHGTWDWFEGDASDEDQARIRRRVTSVGPESGHGLMVIAEMGAPTRLRHFQLQGELGTSMDLSLLDQEVMEEALEQIQEFQTVEGTNRIVIEVEGVRTEGDFDQGLFLHIPAWRENHFTARAEAAEASVGDDGSAPASAEGEDTDGAAYGIARGVHPRFTRKESFVLPIPLTDYHDLFRAFRRRSLFLLLGVFAVGTVLSASLAARFTRPIRRLDRGLRRLSQGDLDVQVEAKGRDEIARLGRAFNEMTRQLRAGRDRERELTRREKLSALGRLAAGVAHDVRNPLHSINLTLQHLQETSRPDDEKRGVEFDRSLGIIREEIARLSRLVENFLRFARSERRERAPVRVPDLLRETAQLVEKEAARRRVELRVEVEDPIPEVLADSESVRSSVLNLVVNSFEAMPEGGALTLSARSESGDVIIEVSDSGEGIPQEQQEKVFDFAYTTREGGHGLGLAMVHQVVVEDHGGRVRLESKPGAGTRVWLAFPVLEPAP